MMRLYQTEVIRGQGWTFSTLPGWSPNSVWEILISNLFANGFDPNAHFFIDFIWQYSCDNMHDEFAWDDLERCAREQRGKKLYVVFDAHTEAPSFANIKELAHRIRRRFGIGFDRMVLWGGGNGGNDCPIRVAQNLNAFSLVTDINVLREWREPTHHFAMLSRMPKAHRVIATGKVLDRGLDEYGTVTCGSAGMDWHDPLLIEQWVPKHLQGRFPLLLDGPTQGHQQHDMLKLDAVTDAFCQVVPETSYEFLYPGWSTVFPTEKSEKCFLLGHVPILLAPAGQVRYMRNLGFDMMDDLVDHSYDNETDPYVRITMVVDQLERICKSPLTDLISWRKSNISRLYSNKDLCLDMRDNFWNIASQRFLDALSHGSP